MSDKEEALAHLSAIKSALIDKDTFFPYNYNALLIWGVIGTVMTFMMPVLMKSSIVNGTIFSLVLITLGFIVEGFLTKKINEDYDIDSCTKKQRFIATIYTMLTFFAIVLSALIAKQGMIVPLFALWLFMCGIGDFVLGYVLNIRIFTLLAYCSTLSAVVLLIVSLFVENLSSIESVFFYISQAVSFLLLGVAPIMISRKLKENQ